MEAQDLEGSQAIPASIFLPDGQSAEKGFSTDSKSLVALGEGQGRAVLSSSQASEQSYMREDGAMSIFTYHFIEALTGHAQPQGGATEVLVSDVLSYIHRQVPVSAQARGCTQTPQARLDGIFPISLLLGGKGLSVGASAPNPIDEPSMPSQGGVIYNVNTGGGANITGNVNTGGGDFVGRDKI